ncbi:MAG: hypothetical protein ABJG42_24250 [Vibrio splendidus]
MNKIVSTSIIGTICSAFLLVSAWLLTTVVEMNVDQAAVNERISTQQQNISEKLNTLVDKFSEFGSMDKRITVLEYQVKEHEKNTRDDN